MKKAVTRRTVRRRTEPVIAKLVDKHGEVHGTLTMYEMNVEKSVSDLNKMMDATCEGKYRYVLPDGFES